MSNAKQCDRCGKLYNNEEIVNNYNDIRMRYVIVKDCHPYPEMKLDLCKACRLDLYKWISHKVLEGG